MARYLLVLGFRMVTFLSVDSGCSVLRDLQGTNTDLFTGVSVEKSTLSFFDNGSLLKIIQTM